MTVLPCRPAAGVCSSALASPNIGRRRNSPPDALEAGLQPSTRKDASPEPELPRRRHYPELNGARSKVEAPRSGVARERGLQVRPTASPVLTTRCVIPSVVPPWVSRDKSAAAQAAGCSSTSTAKCRELAGDTCREVVCATLPEEAPLRTAEKTQAQQALQHFGVCSLEMSCRKGGINQGTPQTRLRSCRSVSPEAFRYEEGSPKFAWKRSKAQLKEGVAGTSERPAALPSSPAPAQRPLCNKMGTCPRLCQADLRAWLAEDAAAQSQRNLQIGGGPGRRQSLTSRQSLRSSSAEELLSPYALAGVSKGSAKCTPASSAPTATTSAGLSHHASLASFASIEAAEVAAVALAVPAWMR
eukprot:TRINITY_DN41359_c0_g1_i1.p1 TRINITY_DN41359_c0_g1~~TRINITY_DN41359_c0_g1_i1.p1  ORF type:complete len:357 (+),score=67.26 TRINITY_DN41359_c0_g1_i1:68-1138(+)